MAREAVLYGDVVELRVINHNHFQTGITMPTTRRSFLESLAAGSLALAAFLQPGKVLACWRRRRDSECGPPACPRPYGGPSNGFNCYYPDGTSVVGGGWFFVWGVADSGITPDSTATFTVGGTSYTGKIVKDPALPSSYNWCYMFSGVPTISTTGKTGTLKVTGNSGAKTGTWSGIAVL